MQKILKYSLIFAIAAVAIFVIVETEGSDADISLADGNDSRNYGVQNEYGVVYYDVLVDDGLPKKDGKLFYQYGKAHIALVAGGDNIANNGNLNYAAKTLKINATINYEGEIYEVAAHRGPSSGKVSRGF